jgi:small basic protein (TIGR04137 family)
MSVDKSLKVRGRLRRMRNVLTRAERIELMEQRRVWQDGDAVYGLPKTKVVKVKKGGKKKKKKKEDEE